MNNIPTLLRRPLLALTFALALALSAGCSKDKPTSKATAGKTTKGKRTKDKKAGAKKDEDKAEDEAKNGDKAEEKDRVEKDDKGEEHEPGSQAKLCSATQAATPAIAAPRKRNSTCSGRQCCGAWTPG